MKILLETSVSIIMNGFYKRYIDLMNFVFEQAIKGKVYLEETKKGTIMTAQDINYFTMIWGRFSEEEKTQALEHPLKINPLLGNEMNEENFPPEGVAWKMHFLNEPCPEQVGVAIKEFFNDFSNTIEVKVNLPDIEIIYPTFKDFKHYVDLINLHFTNDFS